MGNDWCAAATNRNFLRVFGLGGLEMSVLTYQGNVVMVAGYENLLALVYHVSLPLLGCQAMFLEIFDLRACQMIHRSTLPITSRAQLKWFGFSEGLLISYDGL